MALADGLLARHAIFPSQPEDCVMSQKNVCGGRYVKRDARFLPRKIMFLFQRDDWIPRANSVIIIILKSFCTAHLKAPHYKVNFLSKQLRKSSWSYLKTFILHQVPGREKYHLIGSLSNDDGNGNENVSWKSNFALLLLLRDYSNSFNLYNVGVVSRN